MFDMRGIDRQHLPSVKFCEKKRMFKKERNTVIQELENSPLSLKIP